MPKNTVKSESETTQKLIPIPGPVLPTEINTLLKQLGELIESLKKGKGCGDQDTSVAIAATPAISPGQILFDVQASSNTDITVPILLGSPLTLGLYGYSEHTPTPGRESTLEVSIELDAHGKDSNIVDHEAIVKISEGPILRIETTAVISLKENTLYHLIFKGIARGSNIGMPVNHLRAVVVSSP